ncbi:hypothetical protein [Skermanella sp. TT6]|uniref:hypothetical protein n=1 Tax=Skermanella cutis TaxID=2775420 RepID=UPI001FFF1DC9|nr:hypothetical protein [Skermanella sp. TT6]
MPQDLFRIDPARAAADFETTARLFGRYASSLGIDLACRGFAGELATLPGNYAAPGESRWAAWRSGPWHPPAALRAAAAR